jgi:hypothetical protein
MESFKTSLEKQSSVVETKSETILEEKEGPNDEESSDKTPTTKTDNSSTDNSTTDISKTSKSEVKKDTTAEVKSTSDA